MMAIVSPTLLRTTAAVIGADNPLARLVADRLAEGSIAVRRVDVPDPPELVQDTLDGVQTVVVIGRTGGADLDGTGGSELDLPRARRLIDGAAHAGVQSLVVLSGAMVYGARDDNAVPLTEDALIRPEPTLQYAVELAELERLTSEFRSDGARTVAVLRPAVVLGPSSTEWLRRSAWGGRHLPPEETTPPRQFVHVDDLVDAIQFACAHPLDGTFNVAPDGWIAGDTFRELAGGSFPPLPGRLRSLVAPLRGALFGSQLPRGLDAYTRSAWVVANDRLRATGWVPTHTCEEVFVEADHARGWRALSPRTRQELSLAGAAAVVVAAVASIIALVRRRRVKT